MPFSIENRLEHDSSAGRPSASSSTDKQIPSKLLHLNSIENLGGFAYFILMTLFSQSSLKFTAKWRRRYRDSPYALSPHMYIGSPIINIPDQTRVGHL